MRTKRQLRTRRTEWESETDYGTGARTDPRGRDWLPSGVAEPSLHGEEPGRMGSAYPSALYLAHLLIERVAELGGPDPDELEAWVERLAMVTASRHTWNEAIGPVLTRPQLVRLLDTDASQLETRVRTNTLLECVTRDGVRVYPTFQLDGFDLLSGLSTLLEALNSTGVDAWTIASWLKRPLHALDGVDAVTWLRNGGDVERAAEAAQDQAHAWSM